MPPTLANGKICYVEMPATDIARSADFYRRVFGWQIRQRGDGSTAFDDTVGEVSGAWVTGLGVGLGSAAGLGGWPVAGHRGLGGWRVRAGGPGYAWSTGAGSRHS